jgi:hypothetical protein
MRRLTTFIVYVIAACSFGIALAAHGLRSNTNSLTASGHASAWRPARVAPRTRVRVPDFRRWIGPREKTAQSQTGAASNATLQTDKSDYAPETTVHFTGSGWLPGEVVTLHLVESSEYSSD